MSALSAHVSRRSLPADPVARARWEADQMPAPPSHPVVEVPARLAGTTEVPTGPRRVQRAAEAAGWSVVPTYARGTLTPRMHGVRITRTVESLALRAWHPEGWRFVAVWWRPDGANWSHEGAWAWGSGDWPRSIALQPSTKEPAREHLAGWVLNPVSRRHVQSA